MKLACVGAGFEETMVEVRGAEFETCNVTNPIRMLTDPVSHVALEEEGVRYFTSADPESCRNGLKLPVTVNRAHEHEHDFDPWKPEEPDVPSPPYEPWEPDVPSPPHKVPPPPYEPYKPPPTPTPSPAAALLGAGFGLALAAAFWIFI